MTSGENLYGFQDILCGVGRGCVTPGQNFVRIIEIESLHMMFFKCLLLTVHMYVYAVTGTNQNVFFLYDLMGCEANLTNKPDNFNVGADPDLGGVCRIPPPAEHVLARFEVLRHDNVVLVDALLVLRVVDGFLAYQIIVADAADAVSVNFSGRCKFLQI